MPAPLPLILAERFLLLVNRLLLSIGIYQVGREWLGRIPPALFGLINRRIRTIKDRYDRLLAGRYVPRRSAPRARPGPTAGKPRPPRALPDRFGWLADLLPPAVAQQHRADLFSFLGLPETQALIQSAPAEMARLFRPLCWMLKLKPPPILARPRPGAPPPPPYQPPPPPPSGPTEVRPVNTLGLHPIQLAPAPPRKIA